MAGYEMQQPNSSLDATIKPSVGPVASVLLCQFVSWGLRMTSREKHILSRCGNNQGQARPAK
jgi:hypothetical protein